MLVLVTGGAGFLGSHLCDALVARGDRVVCVDDLSTGTMDNVAHLLDTAAFEFVGGNVSDGLDDLDVDAVLHFASPASPPAYLAAPIDCLRVGSAGTFHALELARRHDARFLMASTSEIYGDPHVHPQPEDYWGNVNPIGPRSVYDEAKRFSEAATAAYRREYGTNTGILRFFNTYGPRLAVADGRVVSNFVAQALRGEPLTVYGDGSQTRSFGYVADIVAGVLHVLDSDEPGPFNIGNPGEFTIAELATLVLEMTGSDVPVVERPLPADDPTQRRPDITRMRTTFGWEPTTPLREGLALTIDWIRTRI